MRPPAEERRRVMRPPAGPWGRGLGGGLLLAAAGAIRLFAPAPAAAEDLVVFRDGGVARVERAEELPDRVRIEPIGGGPLVLPNGQRVDPVAPRTVELPRHEIQAVLPLHNPAAALRPHAERYLDLPQQLAEQVRRDRERSLSPAAPPPR